MSRTPPPRTFGLGDEEALALGADVAHRLRIVRALVVLGPRLRAFLDRTLASAGVTTQQAALLTIARADRPSLAEAARLLSTTRQNVRQLASALERKGLLRLEVDANDLRATRLVTTVANDAFWAAREAGDHEAVLPILADLSPDEAATLASLLCRVLDGLEREAQGGAAPRKKKAR